MKGRQKIVVIAILVAILVLLIAFYYGCRSGSYQMEAIFLLACPIRAMFTREAPPLSAPSSA